MDITAISQSKIVSALPWLLLAGFFMVALITQQSSPSLQGSTTFQNAKRAASLSSDIPPQFDQFTPGLSLAYSYSSGRWRWQFAKNMSQGCEKLIFDEKQPVAVDLATKTVTIDLKTYVSDSLCPVQPGRTAVRGALAADPHSKFVVILDGKPVVK